MYLISLFAAFLSNVRRLQIDLLYDLVTRGVRYDFGDNRQVSECVPCILRTRIHVEERPVIVSA